MYSLELSLFGAGMSECQSAREGYTTVRVRCQCEPAFVKSGCMADGWPIVAFLPDFKASSVFPLPLRER